MGSAKDIQLRWIDGRSARRVIGALHYSGKVVNNSGAHVGVFLGGRCFGAMSFGPPLDKRKSLGLVDGSAWDSMLELNRMAFGPELPRNSESRAIAVACRMIRRKAPSIKWILSFSDAAQCGDGTIYRASGFLLTAIKETRNLCRLPSGEVVHKIALENRCSAPRRELGGRSYHDVTGGKYDFAAYIRESGGTPLRGFQLRYVKFLDRRWAERLTVPSIPFSKIEEVGASMYLGQSRALQRADHSYQE